MMKKKKHSVVIHESLGDFLMVFIQQKQKM